jgi:helicase-like protein
VVPQRRSAVLPEAADGTFLVDKKTPAYSSKLAELETRDPPRPVVCRAAQDRVFSEWTTMLDLIEKILRTHRLRWVRLDGSVPQKRRQQIVHEFQREQHCQLFLTTDAGSTGLNLQAADTAVNVDLPWNPAILEQRSAPSRSSLDQLDDDLSIARPDLEVEVAQEVHTDESVDVLVPEREHG